MNLVQKILKQQECNKIDQNTLNEYSLSRKDYYIVKKAIRSYLGQLISDNTVDSRIDDLISIDNWLTIQHNGIMEKYNPTDVEILENDNID